MNKFESLDAQSEESHLAQVSSNEAQDYHDWRSQQVYEGLRDDTDAPEIQTMHDLF